MKKEYVIFGIVFMILIVIPFLVGMYENIGEDKAHNLGRLTSFIIVILIFYVFYKNMSPTLYIIILVLLVLMFQ